MSRAGFKTGRDLDNMCVQELLLGTVNLRPATNLACADAVLSHEQSVLNIRTFAGACDTRWFPRACPTQCHEFPVPSSSQTVRTRHFLCRYTTLLMLVIPSVENFHGPPP